MKIVIVTLHFGAYAKVKDICFGYGRNQTARIVRAKAHAIDEHVALTADLSLSTAECCRS